MIIISRDTVYNMMCVNSCMITYVMYKPLKSEPVLKMCTPKVIEKVIHTQHVCQVAPLYYVQIVGEYCTIANSNPVTEEVVGS